MKVVRKPEVFEAEQWFKMGDAVPTITPKVFTVMCLACGTTSVHGQLGVQFICPGDWVVKVEHDDIRIYNQAVFDKMFEVVKG